MPLHPKVKKAAAGAAIAIPTGVAMLAATFIPRWEGMDLTVKQNSFDRPGVYTVCDGITNLDPDYAWIRPGMKFTPAKCAEAFKKVLPKYYEPLAACMPSYTSMPSHRQVSLLSASFNLGPHTICGTIAEKMNAGDVQGGCEALGRYTHAAGRELKGLVNRRFDPKWGEIAWCLRED